MKYIIAYDLGTGGTKASLFDENGVSIASSFLPYDTYYPLNNFREQKPKEWWDVVVRSTNNLITKVDVDLNDIIALAVAGHSLGAIPLDKDGNLLVENVPIWSDSRADAQAKRFFEKIDETAWYETTGNGFPAPLYSVFKMMWYKDNIPDVFDNVYKFVGTKDYINFRMTGVIATDYSYASGSGVYDLVNWGYKDEFISASGVPADKLPEIFPSTHVLGTLTAKASEELGLPQSVKVVSGGVDNACMALGAGCIGEGEAYTSLGTSSWVAVSSGKPIVEPIKKPFVFTHCVPEKFVSATAIFAAGSSYQWLRNTVCQEFLKIEKDGGEDAYVAMNKLAESSPVGSNNLLFIPALAGGSSLDRSQNLRGAFIGLDLKHTRNDLIRAVLEGVCLNLRLAVDVLACNTVLSQDMLIVGGGGKSPFWRQLFASIYNKNITESNMGQDAGSFGAACLAAVGSGLWSGFDKVKSIIKIKESITPIPAHNAYYERILPVFEKISDMHCDIGDMMADIN